MEAYRIALVAEPEESARGVIGRGIRAFNRQHAGENTAERLCYAVYDADQEIVGGVLGELSWGWLHVDLLWVREELRGRGYGGRLLQTIEEEARRRGARHAFLDTFSFQAPAFYEQHNYRVFGELGDFPAGHRRVFMTKRL